MLKIVASSAFALLLSGCATAMYKSMTAPEGEFAYQAKCTDDKGKEIPISYNASEFKINGNVYGGHRFAQDGILLWNGDTGKADIITDGSKVRITLNDGTVSHYKCTNWFGAGANYMLTITPYETWEEADKAIVKIQAEEQAKAKAIEECKKNNPTWRIDGSCKEG